MKTVNEHNLKFAFFVGRVPPRPLTATFVVKAAFKLLPNSAAELLPEEKQPDFSGDTYEGDDPAKGMRYASDFALFKPGADLLLAGHCHAPGGKPLKQAEVVFSVGEWSKRLVVFGDRFWIKGLLSSSMSEPQPFVSMPLSWSRSFGGPNDPRNTAGRGIDDSVLDNGTRVRLLPNIESLKSLVNSTHDRPMPAGFGPIDPAAPLRASKTGTYNKKWVEQRWPWLPDDFDWSFFNAAPQDQQLQGRFLQGDEHVRVDGMHPQFASYSCRLPGERARLFVKRRKENALVFEEVDLKLDTLFLDMDAETVTLLWRGLAAASSLKLKEFEEVFILKEPLARPAAANLAAYEKLFALRKAEIAKAEAVEIAPIDPAVVAPPLLPDTAWAERLKAKIASLPPIEPDGGPHPLDAEWKRLLGGARPVGQVPPPPAITTLAQGDAAIEREIAKLAAAEPGTAKVFSNVPRNFAAFDKEIAEDEKNMTPGANDEVKVDDDERPEWTRERVQAHAAKGGSFDGEDLSGLDLSHLNFAKLSFRQAVLDEARLSACVFDACDLGSASLAKATLTDATFNKANLENADLSEAIGPGSVWQGANLTAADLTGSKLAGADFRGCTGKQAGFAECDLGKANFEGCKLQQPDFTGAGLVGSNFKNAVMPDAGFYETIAHDSNFEAAHMPRGRFTDAQAGNCNFTRVMLEDGVFENARLVNSNFTEARLARAVFTGARATQAVFLLAHCVSAKFDDAAVSQGRFVQANLFRASFENADLSNATFLGSNCYEVEFFQALTKGTIFDGTNLKGTKLAR